MRDRMLAAAAAAFLQVVNLRAQKSAAAVPSVAASVVLDVVVRKGDHGPLIPGLQQGDFTVLDNGTAQSLASFKAFTGAAPKTQALIVIDAVNVDFQRVAYEREELDHFLRANGGRLSLPTALAIFTDTSTEVENGYTTDGNKLADLLAKQVIGLRSLRRSAGFYGAEERLNLSLKTAGDLLVRMSTQPGRHLVVWFSPGWPLISGPGVEITGKEQSGIFHEVTQFNAALRRSRTTMYMIDPIGAGESPVRALYYEEFVKGLRKPSNAVPGNLAAQVLATQSGGLVLSGSNDLGASLKTCFQDASAYYELRFAEPPVEPGSPYHRVEVRLAEPQLKARTLQGYYAAGSGAAETSR